MCYNYILLPSWKQGSKAPRLSLRERVGQTREQALQPQQMVFKLSPQTSPTQLVTRRNSHGSLLSEQPLPPHQGHKLWSNPLVRKAKHLSARLPSGLGGRSHPHTHHQEKADPGTVFVPHLSAVFLTPVPLAPPQPRPHFKGSSPGRHLAALCCLNWALLSGTQVLEPQPPSTRQFLGSVGFSPQVG